MDDYASLLAPIPGDDPGGADLRYDPLYDRIKELRREDDRRASRGVWITKLKVADWVGTAQLCAEVLTKHSKDLQIAAWLVDAIAARDGLGRLPPALDFLATLSQDFWPVLWPRREPEHEDDPREAVFIWLDGRLTEAVMLTSIAQHEEFKPTWQDRISAQRNPPAPARRASNTAPPELTLALVEEAVDRTPTEFLQTLAIRVSQCRAALDRFKLKLSALHDDGGPSFNRFNTALSTVAAWVRPVLLRRGIDLDGENPPAAGPVTEERTEEAPAAPRPEEDMTMPISDGPISSREEAYRVLESVAGFLERSEPHSPVPLLVRRAISWGRMPLPQLLAELMQDPAFTARLLDNGMTEEPPTPRRSR
ncbi:MAG: type VI secretion system protein TssA [Roseomonas sp.]|nr:type VI secretion system protein TssA [Roseomonas sp.]